MFRIAVGGIHIESSTFTPYISGSKDFLVTEGESLLKRYPWHEKYKDRAELIPLIHARALPGGVVDRVFFDEWLNKFKDLLAEEVKKKKLDAVLFDIHGAMSVQGLQDAEGFISKEIKKIAGEDCIISTPMDLHGNVTDELFNHSDFITCYRTAPHVDVSETRERAFTHLLLALSNPEKKIFKYKVDVPILLPGEKTSTEVSPGRELYGLIEKYCDEEVLDLSIWMGFPWADEERCHGVVCGLGFNCEKVEVLTRKIADFFLEKRKEFEFVGPVDNVENAISQALESNVKPFFISDTGDNPGAGGAGDMNIVLNSMLSALKKEKSEKKILFASLCDEETIEKIYQEAGEEIEISLGAKIDRSFGPPLSLKVRMENLFQNEIAGRGALVRQENIFIIITENRFQYGARKSFENAGIERFEDFDIVVVKMGYLEPDLSAAAKGWVMALSPGAVSQDIKSLNYKNLRKPLFPFDDF